MRYLIKYVLSGCSLLFISCENKIPERITDIDLLPVWNEDSCLYISKSGEQEIMSIYDAASLFREDMALVCVGSVNDMKYGFINDDGNFEIPAIYKQATIFREGIAWVVRKGEAPGALNEKGELKFNLFQAKDVSLYHEGFAAFSSVTKDGKLRWGYVNKKGETVLQPQYLAAGDFSQGKAAVKDASGKWGYIDIEGVPIVVCRFDAAMPFNDKGIAIVSVGGKWGTIGVDGKFVINPRYSEMKVDGENYQVKYEGKWGWCDPSGEFIVKPVFEDAYRFFENKLAPVRKGKYWGYINRKGQYQIIEQFDHALPFVDDLAAVWVNQRIGFIDKNGRFEINPRFDNVDQDYIENAINGTSLYRQVKTDKR